MGTIVGKDELKWLFLAGFLGSVACSDLRILGALRVAPRLHELFFMLLPACSLFCWILQ